MVKLGTRLVWGKGNMALPTGSNGDQMGLLLETSDARRVYGMAGRNGCGDDVERKTAVRTSTGVCRAGDGGDLRLLPR